MYQGSYLFSPNSSALPTHSPISYMGKIWAIAIPIIHSLILMPKRVTWITYPKLSPRTQDLGKAIWLMEAHFKVKFEMLF